ncbi:MAG TPA: trehalose-phosphatase [Acidimicrobiales bacterium]|nr:trehalose-phosphatase [Acidimicrobiales bacterium]
MDLRQFSEDPGRAGIITDFDGTLAPIVEHPADARPLPAAVDLLHALAGRYGRVAVVSGRPAAFLAEHLELARRPHGLCAVGLYGLETADGDEVRTDPRAVEWVPVVEAVAARAERDAPEGAIVERKGLSLTLHYRTAPQAAGWASAWAAAQAAATGLARHPARMSEELRPPVPVDKGTVVAGLAAGLGAVCFLGDDVGDLPAFAALDAAAAGGAVTLKVGVRSEEAPAELLDAADVVVNGPEGAVALLSELLGPAR